MMFLVWPVLFIAGLLAKRLRWQPFTWMLAVIVPMTVVYDQIAVTSAARLGEDESLRWHPLVFALDAAITWALWSAVFLIGYAAGTFRRRSASSRKPD